MNFNLDGVDLTCKHLPCSDIISIQTENDKGELVEIATFTPDGFEMKDPANLGLDENAVDKNMPIKDDNFEI